MNSSGAFSITGRVLGGERRSRSVVNGSSELGALPAPPLRDWRKFWTMAEASVDPAFALSVVSPLDPFYQYTNMQGNIEAMDSRSCVVAGELSTRHVMVIF